MRPVAAWPEMSLYNLSGHIRTLSNRMELQARRPSRRVFATHIALAAQTARYRYQRALRNSSAPGVAIAGLTASTWRTRTIKSLLVEVAPVDPVFCGSGRRRRRAPRSYCWLSRSRPVIGLRAGRPASNAPSTGICYPARFDAAVAGVAVLVDKLSPILSSNSP